MTVRDKDITMAEARKALKWVLFWRDEEGQVMPYCGTSREVRGDYAYGNLVCRIRLEKVRMKK